MNDPAHPRLAVDGVEGGLAWPIDFESAGKVQTRHARTGAEIPSQKERAYITLSTS